MKQYRMLNTIQPGIYLSSLLMAILLLALPIAQTHADGNKNTRLCFVYKAVNGLPSDTWFYPELTKKQCCENCLFHGKDKSVVGNSGGVPNVSYAYCSKKGCVGPGMGDYCATQGSNKACGTANW